jgi:hypothetical protein
MRIICHRIADQCPFDEHLAETRVESSLRAAGLAAQSGYTRVVDDERWEPGMPVLDRQAVRPTPSTPRTPTLPPSLQGIPPRSVPEVAPTPLRRHYINLSVIVLICGAVAITALELGASPGTPLVKLCVAIAAPLLLVTTADAVLRIWRSAWAWMPIDRGKGTFRLAWVAVSLVGLAALVVASVAVLLA